MDEENKSVRPQWGGFLADRQNVLAAWGARAIYTGGYIDLLPDRQDGKGSEADFKRLMGWLNGPKGALAKLRKLTKSEGLRQDEDRVVVIEQPGFRLVANPNASYGYLYICAMLLS